MKVRRTLSASAETPPGSPTAPAKSREKMAGLPVLRHLMYVEGMHRTEGFPFTTVTADTTLVAVGMPASGVDAYSNSDPAPAFQAWYQGNREPRRTGSITVTLP